jgi:hypothetical protein
MVSFLDVSRENGKAENQLTPLYEAGATTDLNINVWQPEFFSASPPYQIFMR